ncbi:MAG TPA: hypothetical protein VJV97_01855 [Gemmatimonadaceae bacterium]|nr:hypothetical protein [Gemmatimonadaceae bacterium]
MTEFGVLTGWLLTEPPSAARVVVAHADEKSPATRSPVAGL